MNSGSDVPSFGEFAREVLGDSDPSWDPYPWQVRFAERWATPETEPPSAVIAPTGAGKTAAIDALVWALARQADLSPAARTASTRIVWAIDRRVLVDEVHDHARALADRLDEALDAGDADPLHGVALRLYRLACADHAAQPPAREERARLGLRPLAVQRWRGGIASREQLHSPFQPQIITSTVAQIGSRLLFRGYGVGKRSLQVAAGLAAADTTVCLDEAHLALPFLETAKAIERFRDGGDLPLPRLRLLTLTATPPEALDPTTAIGLEDADYARLGKRWNGEKTLVLREEATNPEKALTAAVEELLGGGSRVVACVVNRVRTARNVHRELERKLAKDATVVLLVGPQRPAEREQELDRVRGALFDGEEPEQPVVVVATQTIEVGLDADFDAMVTQSASASALTQRLGRLNRSGNRPGRCLVLRDTKSPLYERDEPRAWQWLEERPGAPDAIDASVAAISGDDSKPADVSPGLAATLTPAVVDQLSRTLPRPAPFADPDLDPLLKGIGAEPSGDVQLVWRRDLRFRLPETAVERSALRVYRRALLTLARPEPREVLSLSLAEAKRLLGNWLADPIGAHAKRSAGDDADVEWADAIVEAAFPPPVAAPFVVVRGRQILHGGTGPEADDDAIMLDELKPGDTIVLPTGVRRDGGREAIPGPGPLHGDVMGDRSKPPNGPVATEDRFALRFSWDVLRPERTNRNEPSPEDGPPAREWLALARALNEITKTLRSGRLISAQALRANLGGNLGSLPASHQTWLAQLEDDDVPLRLRRTTTAPPKEQMEDADEEGRLEERAEGASPSDESEADLLARINPLFNQAWVLTRARVKRGADGGHSSPPTLAAHSLAVRERAARFGTWLGLPQPQQQALELAALAHDIGKLDPRFQDFLRAGSATGQEPLAKSVFGTEDPVAERTAREQANLPSRLRHEAESVGVLASALEAGTVPADLGAAEGPLSLLLVGAHHGYGMPLWPVESDGPSIEFEAELLGVAGRSAGTNSAAWLGGRWLRQLLGLQERYGHWGLAYLQALLALADRTVSQEEG